MIGAEGTKTPAGVRGRGDPAGAKRRGERNAEAPCTAPTSVRTEATSRG
ncbi:hypothetical protein [Bacillus sp. X1(2014)]|nr:hypothetical protein [Bacillus sp. X1(2014)]